ncbi:MAG TPA: hypothetical protein VEQ15_00355 [Myxococcales bacterium]|nr:hypothetical protein [Myxococcales bacterium]
MTRVHVEGSEPEPFHERFLRRIRDWSVQPELWAAFGLCTAVAAIGYVAGYRDGQRAR